MKKFTYKEMQENLPDYCFGRLSEEDKAAFERTLPQYPDLREEVDEVGAVFQRVEEIDFDSIVGKKTKNLSVKVQNRLRAGEGYNRKMVLAWRYIFPVAAMVLLAFVFMLNRGGESEVKTANKLEVKPAEFVMLTPAEVSTAVDASIADEDFAAELTQEFAQLYENESEIPLVEEIAENSTELIDEIYEDELAEAIFEAESLPDEIFIGSEAANMRRMLDDFDSLEEDDFQKILEEIDEIDITKS